MAPLHRLHAFDAAHIAGLIAGGVHYAGDAANMAADVDYSNLTDNSLDNMVNDSGSKPGSKTPRGTPAASASNAAENAATNAE